MLIKNKIDEIDKTNKKNKKAAQEKDIEFVFNTFKDIFSSIKQNRFEYMKYFVLIFIHIFFEGKDIIINIYDENFTFNFSYFKILCEQFSIDNNIDSALYSIYENLKKKKIEFTKEYAKINYHGNDIILNLDDYSINSFLINFAMDKTKDFILVKNNSKKLKCKDKIYNEYYNDFIELLKKICCSNVAEILQSLHEDFKVFNSFYSNKKIKNDLFRYRLKFYPFKYENLYGITDKYLLEVYLSSIYFQNIDEFSSISNQNKEIILYIFNMGLNSVIFQHEALNHYVRAYLFYYNEENSRKISIDTKKAHIYYPIQKLDKITEKPKYLNKFLYKLSENELNELSQISKLEYADFLEEWVEKETKDKKDTNAKKTDDEGYYYERQLFTNENEKKLTKFNVFQAIMLIDEDAYNLDPVRFHYCFLELQKSNNYKIIKENFNSDLLSKLLTKLDLTEEENIKNLTFTAKRSSDDGEGLCFRFERKGYDVMSYYANPK